MNLNHLIEQTAERNFAFDRDGTIDSTARHDFIVLALTKFIDLLNFIKPLFIIKTVTLDSGSTNQISVSGSVEKVVVDGEIIHEIDIEKYEEYKDDTNQLYYYFFDSTITFTRDLSEEEQSDIKIYVHQDRQRPVEEPIGGPGIPGLETANYEEIQSVELTGAEQKLFFSYMEYVGWEYFIQGWIGKILEPTKTWYAEALPTKTGNITEYLRFIDDYFDQFIQELLFLNDKKDGS